MHSSSSPFTMGNMKVHQFPRGFWENEPTSLTLGCKRLRPLAPKLPIPDTTNTAAVTAVAAAFDLKSFIRPESAPIKLVAPDDNMKDSSPQVETHPGGTRWNPTPEQISILEMLYKNGMRTPNAQQIEQITTQLRKYGKIEGKNVFYWFQNHKARERQKQKRYNLGLAQCPLSPTATSSSNTLGFDTMGELAEREEDSPNKKVRKWASECFEDESKSLKVMEHRTLELFPLHPECR